MKHKRQTTSDGKIIDIFDNVFTASERSHHITFCQNSKYSLGGKTTIDFAHQKNTFFQSIFSKEDFNNFKFDSQLSFNPIAEKLKNHYACDNKCWVTVSSPLSTYYFHTDNPDEYSNSLTLLYYVNSKWDRNWGGETLFANNDGECEIAVEYKPGRIVIFDSTIEHKPSPISMEASEFRFIFVIQFIKKENEPN
jgi:Rps23 Pro-64 3,4-dihydroxylase Tpa1-like proline 4-hydroxylase